MTLMKPDSIFQRIKKVRIADTVVDQIISLVEEGQLKPGDQLPSERELVNEFQVARPSIREALRILEYQGVIEVRPGKGAFVVGLGNGQANDEQRVQHWFREHAGEVLDILEVRANLEILAVGLAATKATTEQLDEIQAVVDEAQEAAAEGLVDELVRLDREFHQKIASASGNSLLASLIEMLIDSMVNPRRSLMRLRARVRSSWNDHTAILEALRAHNADEAVAAMERHIVQVRSNIIALRDSS
jgi:GntR family transcriptional regulator, transcriptional repressor for pyruvate dehydrogenase complex